MVRSNYVQDTHFAATRSISHEFGIAHQLDVIASSRRWGGHDQENPERGCREEFQGKSVRFSVAIRCTSGCFVFVVKRKIFVAF